MDQQLISAVSIDIDTMQSVGGLSSTGWSMVSQQTEQCGHDCCLRLATTGASLLGARPAVVVAVLLGSVLLCSGLRGGITMSCILARYIVTRASSRIGTNQIAPHSMLISTRNVDLQLKPFIFAPAGARHAIRVVERGAPERPGPEKRGGCTRHSVHFRAIQHARKDT